ncbi:LacI family DNA-binding transcriptional regulator [Novosphingobium rosa]|uniref:LacI family DNA-binding transcriptional regulator n=1 Tax=Novosphingobium rosa TaxID=76978 RepID=UPI0014711271|nr:LacI family DNA-binding transcriptional regulator [Novosphingobium rosa]
MATIKDVADAAGVSFKTVSRVVNGEKSVGPELRERVEQAIRDLGYKPTLAARQLAGQRSFIIGLIVPRLGISYIARMMIALATATRQAGYHLMTEVLDHDENHLSLSGKVDFSARPDCVMLTPPFSNDPRLVAHFEADGIAVVRIATVIEGHGLPIHVDEEPITVELMRHLIALGHRRIGLIGPPLPVRASEMRVSGYRKAMEEAGLPIDPDLMLRGDFSFASGVNGATAMLALPDRPTAIFATGDEMAAGVLAQAHKLGYRVPDDLAVAGFDDSPVSRMVFPALTTVYQPVQDIAQAAVDAAVHGRLPTAPFAYELRIRGSTSGDRQHCLDPYRF